MSQHYNLLDYSLEEAPDKGLWILEPHGAYRQPDGYDVQNAIEVLQNSTGWEPNFKIAICTLILHGF